MDDGNHAEAAAAWGSLRDTNYEVVTTNYVLVEAIALVQRRLGIEALRAFESRISAVPSIHWVDEPLHRQATAVLMATPRRHLSLVDLVSFATMRRLGIDTAFTFDAHFSEQGFRVIP
jgi:predicted nucleic acid-binding protein